MAMSWKAEHLAEARGERARGRRRTTAGGAGARRPPRPGRARTPPATPDASGPGRASVAGGRRPLASSGRAEPAPWSRISASACPDDPLGVSMPSSVASVGARSLSTTVRSWRPGRIPGPITIERDVGVVRERRAVGRPRGRGHPVGLEEHLHVARALAVEGEEDAAAPRVGRHAALEELAPGVGAPHRRPRLGAGGGTALDRGGIEAPLGDQRPVEVEARCPRGPPARGPGRRPSRARRPTAFSRSGAREPARPASSTPPSARARAPRRGRRSGRRRSGRGRPGGRWRRAGGRARGRCAP